MLLCPRLFSTSEIPIHIKTKGPTNFQTVFIARSVRCEINSKAPKANVNVLPELNPLENMLTIAGMIINKVHQPSKNIFKSHSSSTFPQKTIPATINIIPIKILPNFFLIFIPPYLTIIRRNQEFVK